MPRLAFAALGTAFCFALGSIAAHAEPAFQFRARVQGLTAPAGLDACSDTAAVGQTCLLDGEAVFYGGDVAMRRVYFAMADEEGTYPWGVRGTSTGYRSTTDGLGNTLGLVANFSTTVGTNPHGPSTYGVPAAQVCADRGPGWFLPARDQLHLLWLNREAIDLTAKAISMDSEPRYWSSSETSYQQAWDQRFSDGARRDYSYRHASRRVRCARGE